jgi:hypothetical protein
MALLLVPAQALGFITPSAPRRLVHERLDNVPASSQQPQAFHAAPSASAADLGLGDMSSVDPSLDFVPHGDMSQITMEQLMGGDSAPADLAPLNANFSGPAFIETGILDSAQNVAPVAQAVAQALAPYTSTMNTLMAASISSQHLLSQMQNQINTLQSASGSPSVAPPVSAVAPASICPAPQYAEPAPQFAPYVAPPSVPSFVVPSQGVPAGPLPPNVVGAPPQYAFQQLAFAPMPAYYNPFASVPPGGSPSGGAFPRTGLPPPAAAAPHHGRRPSTFSDPLPSSVLVQPAKPLLIDDFLSVNALHALKLAPQKLMLDPTGGFIMVQPALSGTSSKTKCPDLPAWIKASERIKAALLLLLAIQGPDYDRYIDYCLTLLLDSKCGGNGCPLDIFLEFDNAHRIQQWSTGAAFDVMCPLRMAHLLLWLHRLRHLLLLPFLN